MKKFLAATLALTVFATAGAASAQSYRGQDSRYEQSRGDNDGRYARSRDRGDSRYNQRDQRGESRYDRSRDDRGASNDRSRTRNVEVNVRNTYHYDQRASRRYNAGRYYAPRGYQVRQWHRGDRMPAAYRGRGYVVDHRRYGLSAPPRGYHYVRSGNDAVLTAVATGVIASVIISLFQ